VTAARRRGSADRAVRRAELLDAADRVISVAGPEASMRTIAAGAGITKPILYRYFGDKGGLFAALADRYLEPLVAAVRAALAGADDSQRIRATVAAYLGFIEDNPQIYRFLMQRALPERPEAAMAVSAAVRRLGLEVAAVLREEFRLEGQAAVGAEAVAHGIVGMVHVAGDWWLADRRLSRAELVEHLTVLLGGGLDALQPRLAEGITSS
jgi:AcrR family transcriptional regulator